MGTEYEKAWADYQKLAERAMRGDAQAKRDKQKAREVARHLEREAAREGTILVEGRNVTAAVVRESQHDEIPSKKEAQRAYLNQFDAETPVVISTGRHDDVARDPEDGSIVCGKDGQPVKGKVTTLRGWHRKRLGIPKRGEEKS